MPILNVQSLSPNNGYNTIRNWGDQDYWYVSAKCNEELIIPNEIVHSNLLIAVCTEFEAYDTIVKQIYDELVTDLNISPDRIILLSENSDLTDIIIKEASYRNKGLIHYEWTLLFEHTIKTQTIKNYTKCKNIRPKTNASDKYFLNFNRRWRIHRPMFVGLLYASNLADKGYISLPAGDSVDGIKNNWTDIINSIKQHLVSDEHLSSLISTHIDQIKSIPALYLDTTELHINRDRLYYDDIDQSSTSKLYEDTAFSVVSETFFFEDIGRFLSEKTFKPIAYHHPFILINRPFSLQLLRDLGYKTFEPFINESYDREVDNNKRMRMILQEVERLCNMDTTEIDQFLKNVQSITDHNFKKLTNTYSHVHKKI